VKEFRGDDGIVLNSPINQEERSKAAAGDYGWLKVHYALKCDFAVWDEGHRFDPAQRHVVIAKTNRRDGCFFRPYASGMLLQAAKTLQEREAAYARAARDRLLTIVGLLIAAAALFVQAYLSLAQPLKWWPYLSGR